MPDSPEKESQSNQSGAIDLSQLEGLSFGPDWSSSSSRAKARKSGEKRSGSPGSKGSGQQRDRRPAKAFRNQGSGSSNTGYRSGATRHADGRGPKRDSRRRASEQGGHRGAPAFFQPTVEVLFYPEDLPFKALSQAIRRHCRTYELFEIAKLILEKPERYVVVVKPKPRQGETQPFFVSIPDGAPFESEQAALNHVMRYHLEQFFTIEETAVEPPKGSFPSVNKCGMTGELLGPPNYHRYQALVNEHHTTRLAHVPFAKFESKIETVKDEDVITEWVNKMTKVTRYTVKNPTSEETPIFDTLESAKNYLLAHCKDKIVGVRDQTRISGRLVHTLPDGPIKKSIETVLEMQQRFPLDTANNLRGRLRRMKFTIYKRGSKGVSYVCAVKRRFREEDTVFAEDISALIEFIEKHPNISVKDLPKAYLGLETYVGHDLRPPVEKAPDMAAAEATLHQEGAADGPVEAPTESNAAATAETPATHTAEGETSAAQEQVPAGNDFTAKATAATGASSSPDFIPRDLPEADQEKIRKMMMSLQWLVQEGYVTEFGDGSLFAPARMATPKSKTPDVAKEGASVDAQTTATTVEDETAEATHASEPTDALSKEMPSPANEPPASGDENSKYPSNETAADTGDPGAPASSDTQQPHHTPAEAEGPGTSTREERM